MANTEAYQIVIADLERQLDEINTMISRLKGMSEGVPASSLAQDVGDSAHSAGGVASAGKNPFLGMKVVQAAKIVLADQRVPMSPAGITIALENGGLPVASSKTVASVLHRRSKEVGDVVSPKRGHWGLKEWYPGRSFSSKDTEKDETANQPNAQLPPAALPRIVPLPSSD